MAEQRYYIGSPAVDALTLSTFGRPDAAVLRQLARSVTGGGFHESRFLQYVGEADQDNHYFSGTADQGGRDHYLIRCSSALAHDFALLTHEAAGQFPRTKATRVDVQLTVPLWAGFDLQAVGLDLKKHVASGRWPFRGRRARRREVNLVLGSKDLHTIYIGDRASERFIRVYVKDIADRLHIRFEMEYKGDLAVQAWAAMLNHGAAGLGPLLRGELDMLPASFVAYLTPIEAALVEYDPERLQVVTAAATWERQLKWVRKQVAPTLEKLLASPARDDLRDLLRDLLENY